MGRLLAWLSIAAALGVGLIAQGNVFPDEGWYLYAGQMVADGHVPYRDFAHFQAPLGPYLFRFAGGELVTGRALALTFGLGAIGLALDLARRRGPDVLVATALVLVPATYTLRWFAVARNIAPAAFFLMLGVWLAERRKQIGSSAVCAAAVAMALAAGLRLSAAGGLVALVADELRCRRWRAAAFTCATGALALAAIFGPFWLTCPEGLAFGTFGYHTGLPATSSKALGLLRLADHHHLLMVALWLAFYRAARAWWRGDAVFASEGVAKVPALPALVAVCVTALHLVPGRLHPEYHELVMPLLALVAGTACTRELAPARWGRKPLWLRLGIAVGMLVQVHGASGQRWANEGWSPRMVEEVGAELERVGPAGQPVLTFVPDFALAADLPLMSGLEMGSVSVAAPTMPVETARRLHVVTLGMLEDALRARQPGSVVWRALEDADARRVGLYPTGCAAEIEAVLRAGYERVGERHGWSIWRRRSP